MQRIVIDTNVLISGLISKGIPSKIISELVLARKVVVCLSKEIWREYLEVIHREKFSKYPLFKKNAELVLSEIENISLNFLPNLDYNVIKDQSDNKFLELAVYSSAEFLITGNTLDFNINRFENVNIVTPKEYWENHKP